MRIRSTLLCVAVLTLAGFALGQRSDVDAVRSRDSEFWAAYNKCDTEGLRSLLTEDVEFYHDKGGATIGLEKLVARIKENICSDPDYRIRRAALASSARTSLLKHGDEIYGAVVAGSHLFYVKEKNRERLHDRAEFLMVWLKKDSRWLAARIVSYAHQDIKHKH